MRHEFEQRLHVDVDETRNLPLGQARHVVDEFTHVAQVVSHARHILFEE